MSKKIIAITGYGNTGSSAATNFFEEFNCIQSIGSSGFECTFIHEKDGLFDLYNALREGHRLNVDLAVKRFLSLAHYLQNSNKGSIPYSLFFSGNFYKYTIDYINSLGLVNWLGGWHRAFEENPSTLFEKIRYKAAKSVYNYENKKNSYSLYENDGWHPQYMPAITQYYEDFSGLDESFLIEKTKKYLESLFNAVNTQKEILVFDQLLPANTDESILRFFDDIKLIVVDRDPRDLYFANKVFWGNRFIPSSNVRAFIKWYKKTRKRKALNDSRVMYLSFEDLIYNYETASEKLYKFTNVTQQDHTAKKSILVPEKSMTNTLFWKKYTTNDAAFNEQIEKDLLQIENELSDFCFSFPKEHYNKTYEKTIVNEPAEKNFLIADDYLTMEKIPIGKKLKAFALSVFYSDCTQPLIRAISWTKSIKKMTFSLFIKSIIKIVIYCIYIPFGFVYNFFKSLLIFVL